MLQFTFNPGLTLTSFRTTRPWRAFLKRPENFSGPKTLRGSFRVNFSGPGKRFSTRPKTPRILTILGDPRAVSWGERK